MSASRAVPLLVRLLIGVLLAAITWAVGHVRARNSRDAQPAGYDALLLSLLVFAVFAAGVFLTYALFDLGL